MIVCPNAKINIGLEVVRKRADGYHDIETLFVPAPGLSDVLEVVKADEPQLTTYGIPCDVPMEKNLCFKAFRLIQDIYGIGNVHIFLYKNIPTGAGLGGGSSDAAFTLTALNSIFELGLDKPRLAEIAAQLGSDCPFFIYNQPMFATGRGEILTPYPLDLSGYRIEIITTGIHISTPEAYKGVDDYKAGLCESKLARLAERLTTGITSWRENVVNDFELYAFAKYPILAEIKQELYDRGAVYASMTGSGSAMYGIFRNL